MMDANQHIDALLDGHSPAELYAAIHERKRRRLHEAAKAAQPRLTGGVSAEDFTVVAGEALRPLEAGMSTPDGLEYLLLTVRDCLREGRGEDTLFALVRMWRKTWALHPHLGAIEK